MNAGPTWMVWLQLLGLLAGEVALVVAGAAWLQRFTGSAWWRRTIWQVCLVGLLSLPLFELTGAARGLADWLVGRGGSRIPGADQSAGAEPGAGREVAARVTDEFRQQVAERATLNRQREMAGPRKPQAARAQPRAELLQTIGASPAAPPPQGPMQQAATADDSVADSMAVLYLGLAWLAGVALFVARGCVGCFLRVLFRWRRRTVVNPALRARVEALARALGVARRVRLVESARLAGPIVFGAVRATLGLPAGFAKRFTPAQQEAMLAHELAHLAARDPAWYLVADLASAVLWWHPLVWWARRQLHAASETAADEASLLVADGPAVLAECLVEMGTRLGQRRSLLWMGVEGDGFRSGLGRRVERLVNMRGNSWAPPSRLRSLLAKTLGPAALLAALISGTAWVGPQAFTKGESMKTMKQTWKRSLAAFALLASLPGESHAGLAADTTINDKSTDAAALVREGKRLYETGKLDEAESKLKEAVKRAPDNTNAFYFLSLVQERRYAQGAKDRSKTETKPAPAVEKPADPADNRATEESAEPTPFYYNRLMMQRYGLMPKVPPPPVLKSANRKEGSPIAAKLEKVLLDEVLFDGVPLPQVLQFLDEESRKRDPEKQGVNFLINPNAPASTGTHADPNTGVIVPAPPPEPLDMNSVIVRFNLPLRNVRLKDALDAIVKVADKPIEYSVEGYGVVFSQSTPLPAAKGTETPSLTIRTFKVDTNTFLNGLKRAFSIGFEPEQNATTDQIRSALRDVFSKLGIDMGVSGKTVFYNDLTGIVMVRATFEDLEIVKAAIETLGGVANDPAAPAASITIGDEFRQRYGLGPARK